MQLNSGAEHVFLYHGYLYHKLFTPLEQHPGLLTHFVYIKWPKNSKLRFETLNKREKNPTVIKNLEQSLYRR